MTPLTVRLIAPSGYPHDHDAMHRGVARLRAAGCAVEGTEVLERVDHRFAGDDAARVADINALATASTLPDIALSVRGGYGATRLLEHIRYDALRERLAGANTLLVGHSDFTAIQMALHVKCGLVTFGGPMLGADFGAPELNGLMWEHFWRAVGEPQATARWSTPTPSELDVEGPLWGGNLAMLCSLLGTPYFPAIDGGILFVEDVGEPPFRIERLLYQLHLSGVLDRQRALVLGHFTHCRPHAYDNGFDTAAAFAQIARVARIPIVHGLPFGHEVDKFTLPFGAPARLSVAEGQASLTFQGHPTLARTVFRPEPGTLPQIP
ncbi:murein tetrapeptidase LD-carboxypeptidase Serine peptidase. MEROPS family S66 [Dyella jiangningensis]|uniref:muramoyltetrapeptide carboxypeptidase n=1 Tax=Dyella sp. AtDHG13 TaxID=1938897 RepID=UPI00088713DA|nr:muramoyltetrapeptide carboxypeptidase [Dyella sp. AtDHG13]PXV52313.1 murein tetrapeptidase LD-carboxypeptidase [Dyella sp. AtDHG13]SDK15391.1 murein tetrapeptidase LD-carboxypeptidase Serine peptidase. MEROPS family S66 [Dyella jiangningensis]